MAGWRFLYRFLGAIWTLIGLLIFGLSLVYIIAFKVVDDLILTSFPEVAEVIGPIVRGLGLGLQQVLGLLFGVFCLVIGSGLMGRKTWARTVGVAFHIAMGGCLAALTLTLYVRLSTPGLLGFTPPELLTNLLTFLGAVLSLGLLAVGFQMSTRKAMDAFCGSSPKLPPMAPVKCPTCGGPLDLDKGRCPKCDAPTDEVSGPVHASLLDEETGKRYPVSTRKPTRIGRDTPGLEVQLTNPTVSGEHAIIEYVEGHFYLHSQKALNHTFVNDMERPIYHAEIRNGDLIGFGAARLRFVVER